MQKGRLNLYFPQAICIIKKLIMKRKTTKWSTQEQNRLKELKQRTCAERELNWKEISIMLNSQFERSKTSKQCRQRYINYLKFDGEPLLTSDWSLPQLKAFENLYIQHGSSWRIISEKLVTKSQNTVKNKFNNSLRRAVKKLNKFQFFECQNGRKKGLSSELLVSMIDFSNQLQRKITDLGLHWNKQSDVYRFRCAFIKYCLSESQQCSRSQIIELVHTISKINIKLRSFGVYKVKHRKNWKISDKCFKRFIMSCNIIKEEEIDCLAKLQIVANYDNSNQIECGNISSEPNSIDQLQSFPIVEIKQDNLTMSQGGLMKQITQNAAGQVNLFNWDDLL